MDDYGTSCVRCVMQRETAVTTYLKSKQLLLLAFGLLSVCQYLMAEDNPAAQRQTAVAAHLKTKQLLLFIFGQLSACHYSMAEKTPAAQRQTPVTVHSESKQLLLFVFAQRQKAVTFTSLTYRQ